MTSSIPMFNGALLGNNGGYFTNCFTDVDGLIKKIKKNSVYAWQSVVEKDNSCIDVKLNHSKNNLYVKKIDLNDKLKYSSDYKTLYIVNSFKMAIEHCVKEYAKKFNINVNFSKNIDIYRQTVSTVFDKSIVSDNHYTVIMFLNEDIEMQKMKVEVGESFIDILPMKSSLIILPPNTRYIMGYFNNSEQYYAMSSFYKSDII